MARIVDINALVPEDIVIRYGTPPKDYRLPGDLSVETVFRLFEMFQALTTVTGSDAGEVVGELRQRFGDIEHELLLLFQQRDPKLEKLPFGIGALGQVLRVILGQLGLTVTDENPTPPTPTPSSARTRSKPARKR